MHGAQRLSSWFHGTTSNRHLHQRHALGWNVAFSCIFAIWSQPLVLSRCLSDLHPSSSKHVCFKPSALEPLELFGVPCVTSTSSGFCCVWLGAVRPRDVAGWPGAGLASSGASGWTSYGRRKCRWNSCRRADPISEPWNELEDAAELWQPIWLSWLVYNVYNSSSNTQHLPGELQETLLALKRSSC